MVLMTMMMITMCPCFHKRLMGAHNRRLRSDPRLSDWFLCILNISVTAQLNQALCCGKCLMGAYNSTDCVSTYKHT